MANNATDANKKGVVGSMGTKIPMIPSVSDIIPNEINVILTILFLTIIIVRQKKRHLIGIKNAAKVVKNAEISDFHPTNAYCHLSIKR